MENKDKKTDKFSNFMSKASDFGKKAADGIQKGAKDLSEQTQKALYEQRMKHYNPLFKDKFFSDDFKLPNIIKIVDDAERRGIDVCEGAIGWTKKTNDVEILYLYDEFICDSKINFVPVGKCDSVYCVDNFDKTKYIDVESIFDGTLSEKMAELEHVAYSLGAKSYSIEMVETNIDTQSANDGVGINLGKSKAGIDSDSFNQSKSYQGGKNITYIDGEREPVRPTLKWFKNDENIKNLIEMRCSGNGTVKSKVLQFKGSSSATMSQKCAVAIDAISKIGAKASMEKKSIKEHSTLMILEIEF